MPSKSRKDGVGIGIKEFEFYEDFLFSHSKASAAVNGIIANFV